MSTEKEFNFGTATKEATSGYHNETTENPISSTTAETEIPKHHTEASSGKGNRMDASTINVTISDQKSPIVILFGPSMCGKTMTLVRLTRYLTTNYCFSPDKSFKDSSDEDYKELCEHFNAAVDSDKAADGTRYIDFMLLRVNDKIRKRTFCQFVESPGEFLFDPDNKDADFPAYFETIRGSNNPKIWVFFLEPSLSNSDKKAYVRKITEDIVFGEDDRFIFLVNKIDMPETKHLMLSMSTINQLELRNYVDEKFPGLIDNEKFLIHRMFLGDKELFKLVGFQTGTYKEAKDIDGKKYKTFQAGHKSHPQRLWKVIEGAVKGDW